LGFGYGIINIRKRDIVAAFASILRTAQFAFAINQFHRGFVTGIAFNKATYPATD
jgi:hypothetical protein